MSDEKKGKIKFDFGHGLPYVKGIRQEQRRNKNMMTIADAIKRLMSEGFELEAGDSGYDFMNKVRDMTFYNDKGYAVEITVRELEVDQAQLDGGSE